MSLIVISRMFVWALEARWTSSAKILIITTTITTITITPTRMFVWNLEEGRVTEQMVVTIPATPGNLFPGLNVQNRWTHVDGHIKINGSSIRSSTTGTILD